MVLIMQDWYTPYHIPSHECLSIGGAPSQGIVYAINEDVVVKLPFQYPIPDSVDPAADRGREDSLQAFELLRKEKIVYKVLAQHPHPNIVRCVTVESAPCLFIERVATPLREARAEADVRLCKRWIRQLLNAIVMLAELGYTHGDLAAQNIGSDKNDCLKIYDFGSVMSKSNDAFHWIMEHDQSGLSDCLYFLLSGVDPLDRANSWDEVRRIKLELKEGRYPIAPEAGALKEVLLDGWMGRHPTRAFRETRKLVESIIGAGDDDPLHVAPSKEWKAMEVEAVKWLETATWGPNWINEEEFRKRWGDL